MKILYLDLNCSSFFESYSINARRYGGNCVGKYFKEYFNNGDDRFIVAAPAGCFDELGDDENKSVCYSVNLDFFEALKNGAPFDALIPNLNQFDLILYGNTCQYLNKGNYKGPLVHWSGSGRADACSPCCDYSLLYNRSEKQIFPNTKVKYVKIGKSVPKEFQEHQKEDYIIQVSQHCEDFNSIEVAQNCLKYGIKGIFAGPIFNDYKLLDYIDNKTTFYKGQISEVEKLELYKKAKLLVLLNKNEVPFNQSVIEAQGLGTPILVNHRGPFFCDYLKERINGFGYNNNFLEVYQKSHIINQKDCWLAAKEYDVEAMVGSFRVAFNEIISEWYKI